VVAAGPGDRLPVGLTGRLRLRTLTPAATSATIDNYMPIFLNKESPMTPCEKMEKCQFFNDKMDNMPPTSRAMKDSFCMGDKKGCARYLVSTSGLPVPPDLFPHMTERAMIILGRA
jgi:hypothetical protein